MTGRATLLPLALLAALAAGCGGGEEDDREEAEQTVRSFVEAANERDGERFCRELVTREFLEETTGATGDEATEACEKELDSVRDLSLKLIEIRKTEVDGERARVTAVLERQGERRTQLLRLRREDGDWKLAGGQGG